MALPLGELSPQVTERALLQAYTAPQAPHAPKAPLCKGSWQRVALTEGLMQSKNKFLAQYSTTPDSKNKFENFYKPMSTRQTRYRPPGARFFLLQRRKNRGRKTPLRAGGGPPALRTHPWVRRRYYSRTLCQLPGRFARASVPWWLVSRPLAASLLLTGCCGDLGATVVGGL